MAKPDFLAAALDQLLHDALPHHGPLRQLSEGEESRAFAFDAEDETFVVRVNHKATGFEMDRLIGAVLSDSTIPVPEVVTLAPLDGGGFACVSRRLPGVTLQELPNGDAFEFASALAQVLDRLAELDGARLNQLAASPLMSAREDWPDFMATVTRLDWRHVGVSARRSTERWTNLLAGSMARLPHRRRLVHGDFGSNNVLVHQGAVSGVLDWSEVRIGDPLYDVANIAFWRSWLDCMEQQCRYFEQHEPWRLAEQETLICYQLQIGLMTLHEAFADGDLRLAGWAMQRCSEIAAQA